MNDKNPMTSTEKTSDLYPQSGLRELFARISATIPNAGKISTYTSGCPRNQNKCCHKSGLPPPLIDTGAPFTTSPAGRKKLVCATRSINCMMIAASSGGNASSSRNAVTNCDHTKNGSRIQVRPLARSWMMVVMKLTAPSNDDVIRKIKPTSQRVCPLKKGSNPGPLSEMSES